MERIKDILLTETIPYILDVRTGMPKIRFVFDRKTLEELADSLNEEYKDVKNNEYSKSNMRKPRYEKGLKSMAFLWNNLNKYQNGDGDIFIPVHDSEKFFFYLDELINVSKDEHRGTIYPSNTIRSIWLRMGIEDIENVEIFLRRQIAFIKNYNVFQNYLEYANLSEDNEYILAYRFFGNEDWFETNESIVFEIRRTAPLKNLPNGELDIDSLADSKDYRFPSIHFGLVRENGKNTCYLYGVQQIGFDIKDESVKEYIQPVRKQLRNKYVSADTLIALSLFFDLLFKIGIKDIVVPTLQFFNYPYHENLSEYYKGLFSEYTEEERKKLEEDYNNRFYNSETNRYMGLKDSVERFGDKQDMIS